MKRVQKNNSGPKPKITLILGAGCSCEAELPSTQQLSEQFLDIPDAGVLPPVIEREISTQLKTFWEKTFAYGDAGPKPSLEDHFTMIDLAANTGHHLGPTYSPKKLRAIRRFSIHRAFQILETRYRESATISRMLSLLSKSAELSIVTVNWDVVIENHAQSLGLKYDYGTTVKPLEAGGSRGKNTPLLKLHGSANWVYCDSCRTLFSGPPDAGKLALHLGVFMEKSDFNIFDSPTEVLEATANLRNRQRKCVFCGCLMSARVGTFSYRKDYAIQQFQTIWQAAFDALREGSVWLFVGYSMPEADFEFRHSLKSAELAQRNERKKSIQVVLKSPDRKAAPAQMEVHQQTMDRYRRFFGLTNDCLFEKGLKEWVETDFEAWLQGCVDKVR
jgi:hypothetical protein